MSNTEVRTWRDNADEFGAISRGEGGWSLAILVACSVELGVGTGDNQFKVPTRVGTSKVSAQEFAKRASVSDQTVLRYLKKWAEAIENGAPVPPASRLLPADVGTIPLPAKPFNGPDGYVKTGDRKGLVSALRSVDEAVASIAEGDTALVQGIAKSPEAMKALIEKLTPKAVTALVTEVSDMRADEIADAIEATRVEAATEAAKATGEPVDEDFVEEVQWTAKRRAKANRSTVAEEMPGAADYAATSRRVEAKRKAEETADNRRYFGLRRHIVDAIHALGYVLRDSDGDDLSDEHKEFLAHEVDRCQAVLDLIRLRFTGVDTGTDWDAELAKLGAAE